MKKIVIGIHLSQTVEEARSGGVIHLYGFYNTVEAKRVACMLVGGGSAAFATVEANDVIVAEYVRKRAMAA